MLSVAANVVSPDIALPPRSIEFSQLSDYTPSQLLACDYAFNTAGGFVRISLCTVTISIKAGCEREKAEARLKELQDTYARYERPN
jgi:hypothetical protein